MRNWVLPLLEVSSFGLVIWCMADAWKRGRRFLLELLAGALFGLLIEQIAIWAGAGSGRADAYRYTGFIWMATPDVPLVVAASWGALLYAAMKFADGLGIPVWLRPAADGLYALMLDLTMEVAAVHLGFWRWGVGLREQWFGAPFSNFGGWLVLAVAFSTFIRPLRRGAGAWPIGLHAGVLAAGTCGLAYLTIRWLGWLFSGRPGDIWPVGLMGLAATALVLGGLIWRRLASPTDRRAALADAPRHPDWWDPGMGLPAIWHILYLAAAAGTGIFTREPSLLFLTGILAASGTVIAVGLLPVPSER